MSMIDWSKAPEWATGYGLMSSSFGIEEVWFNDEQYRPLQSRGGYGPYPFGGGVGPYMHNATKGQISFQQHRPAPWMGEGLPPVGTVCEFKDGLGGWRQVEITAIARNGLCFVEPGKSAENYVALTAAFRPLRTPEQIAAEEREKAIDAILDDLSLSPECRYIAKRVHEAGYRKVTP